MKMPSQNFNQQPFQTKEFFSELILLASSDKKKSNPLKASYFDTKLGPMIAITDKKTLYFLDFMDRSTLKKQIDRLTRQTNKSIISGESEALDSIEKEISQYFEGSLHEFKTPTTLSGTPFQKSVWQTLQKIPHGQTRSYADISATIKKPSAFRAVANANAANKLAIIIPCHRIINANGSLGGYAGGLSRKQWLLTHENTFKSL